jgi:hypothetical protein
MTVGRLTKMWSAHWIPTALNQRNITSSFRDSVPLTLQLNSFWQDKPSWVKQSHLLLTFGKTPRSNDHSYWSLSVLPSNWEDVTSCLALTVQIYNYLLINKISQSYEMYLSNHKNRILLLTALLILYYHWLQHIARWGESTLYIGRTSYWGYLIVLWLFHLVCILYCVCFNLFCNV